MVEIDDKQVFSIVQKARETGQIKIGINEITKSIERGDAKLVVSANDVSPGEIIAHLPGLTKEMNILYVPEMASRAELGAAAGIKSASSIAVTDAGSAKKELDKLVKETSGEEKEAESKDNEESSQEEDSSSDKE